MHLGMISDLLDDPGRTLLTPRRRRGVKRSLDERDAARATPLASHPHYLIV